MCNEKQWNVNLRKWIWRPCIYLVIILDLNKHGSIRKLLSSL